MNGGVYKYRRVSDPDVLRFEKKMHLMDHRGLQCIEESRVLQCRQGDDAITQNSHGL